MVSTSPVFGIIAMVGGAVLGWVAGSKALEGQRVEREGSLGGVI
ncbi:hypothetical protein [Thermococcus sp. JCM 11816]